MKRKTMVAGLVWAAIIGATMALGHPETPDEWWDRKHAEAHGDVAPPPIDPPPVDPPPIDPPTDPGEPPPSDQPCKHPAFPLVTSGDCVDLCGRTYTTRRAADTRQFGDGSCGVGKRNATHTYLGEKRSGRIEFEWFADAGYWQNYRHGGKHEMEIWSLIADRGPADLVGTHGNLLRAELVGVGRPDAGATLDVWWYRPDWRTDGYGGRDVPGEPRLIGRKRFANNWPRHQWIKFTWRWEQTEDSFMVWIKCHATGEEISTGGEIGPAVPIQFFSPAGHVENADIEWIRWRNLEVH